ncbi:hypothetical protein TRFO_29479 [Tritrichomonas foetus]|uniref:Rab-GAP TBC domain-containing protein n=1 Tax=Tritrichomonas foetus TaxID=1144522 RepID=A0A1J4JXP2_9EUKA|nr:hypothetical protein TRFO_29479 [Tritrichomonas foetus]|eukprot:OHT03224.1 hypothetical protein TRFO_29479 [Tritrichomonas foetus]
MKEVLDVHALRMILEKSLSYLQPFFRQSEIENFIFDFSRDKSSIQRLISWMIIIGIIPDAPEKFVSQLLSICLNYYSFLVDYQLLNRKKSPLLKLDGKNSNLISGDTKRTIFWYSQNKNNISSKINEIDNEIREKYLNVNHKNKEKKSEEQKNEEQKNEEQKNEEQKNKEQKNKEQKNKEQKNKEQKNKEQKNDEPKNKLVMNQIDDNEETLFRINRIFTILILSDNDYEYSQGEERFAYASFLLASQFATIFSLPKLFVESLTFSLTKKFVELSMIGDLVAGGEKSIDNFARLDAKIAHYFPKVAEELHKYGNASQHFAMRWEMLLFADEHEIMSLFLIWDHIIFHSYSNKEGLKESGSDIEINNKSDDSENESHHKSDSENSSENSHEDILKPNPIKQVIDFINKRKIIECFVLSHVGQVAQNMNIFGGGKLVKKLQQYKDWNAEMIVEDAELIFENYSLDIKDKSKEKTQSEPQGIVGTIISTVLGLLK